MYPRRYMLQFHDNMENIAINKGIEIKKACGFYRFVLCRVYKHVSYSNMYILNKHGMEWLTIKY